MKSIEVQNWQNNIKDRSAWRDKKQFIKKLQF